MADSGGGRGRGAPPPGAGQPPRPTISPPPVSAYDFPFHGDAAGGEGPSDVIPCPLTPVSSSFFDDVESEFESFAQLVQGAMNSFAGAPPPPWALGEELMDAEWDLGCEVERREEDDLGQQNVEMTEPSPIFTVPPGISPSRLLHSPSPSPDPNVGMTEPSPIFTAPPGISPFGLLGSASSSPDPNVGMTEPSPIFTVPPGFSPFGLLGSASSSPDPGKFGMSHQLVAAQVTAQAVQSQFQMHYEAGCSSSLSVATATSLAQNTSPPISLTPTQEMSTLPSNTDNNTFESGEGSHSDQRSQPAALIIQKPPYDGCNWRKYAQKMLKGSEYPRSYYKCKHPDCPATKMIERSFDGQIIAVVYRRQHKHQRPQPNKRAKGVGALPSGSNELDGNPIPADSEPGSQAYPGNFSRSNETMALPSASERDQASNYGTPEQLAGASGGEETGDVEQMKVVMMRTDEGSDSEPDPKRRKIPASMQRMIQPRFIFQTTSEIDLLDDGYKWRMYSKKVLKGNPNPRSYYKCSHAGCNAKKHVQRSSTEPSDVITTYDGIHNHPMPAARSSNDTHWSSLTQESRLQKQ